MKIISLINEFTNSFNKIFQENLNPLNLESKIKDVGMVYLHMAEDFSKVSSPLDGVDNV